MVRVVFDSNIYDKLAADPETIGTIAEKIATGTLVVMVSPIIVDELRESQFGGVPQFFPIQQITEAIAVAGYAIAGLARPSDGVMYEAHRGTSKKSKDAIVAETAESDCDMLVSEDRRCRDRLNRHAKKCKALDYAQFKQWLGTL